jgi:uncharacterized repeat protein (TIGR03803 family)
MANSAMASGPQESTRYNFAGNGHATDPFDLDGLVADRAGNLYGTAEAGGEKGNGAIFEFVRPTAPGQQWTENILYSFQNESDGRYPMGGLVFDQAGNLYGTTAYGGAAESGSVFELSPPAVAGGAWTEITLHEFLRGNDGGVPVCGVVLDSRGNLYGATYYGGPSNAGIIYELSPPADPGQPWTETVLHVFNGSGSNYPSGAYPDGGLLLDPSGSLYGTTSGGGGDAWGLVFKLVPPAPGESNWREQILYTFTNGSDGSIPVGDLALGENGSFYGVAYEPGGFNGFGYGMVYQMSPPTASGATWTHQTIYTFADGGYDALPVTLLYRGGALYGTAAGVYGSNGQVYELTQQAGAWVKTTLHEFDGNDGTYPSGRLVYSDGAYYGTTLSGGRNGDGVFYEVVP